jgi:8-oxo-dGTP diphosphatase
MLEGQRLQPERYTVVPRTISFVFHDDHVLLIRLSEDRGAWAGKLNGVGGHIERGEDPHASALREIKEETGLTLEHLQFCGHILIDTGKKPGIGLFVFGSQISWAGSPLATSEGTPCWIAVKDLENEALVEDLNWLIPKVRSTLYGAPPFLGLYQFDTDGGLIVNWIP